MNKAVFLILSFVVIFILFVIFIGIGHSREPLNPPIPTDSIINTAFIDSLRNNVRELDSTIIKIKTYEKKQIDEVNTLDDSSSIELFKELVK